MIDDCIEWLQVLVFQERLGSALAICYTPTNGNTRDPQLVVVKKSGVPADPKVYHGISHGQAMGGTQYVFCISQSISTLLLRMNKAFRAAISTIK
jgi:hypothetical protein